MKKTLSLVLVLTILVSAMLGVTSAAAEPEESPKLGVTYANLQFGSTVYLLIAVDYTAAYSDVETAKEKVTVSVDGEELTADKEVMAIEDFPVGCVGFKYTKLGAKNMGDELEIKVYDDGAEQDSTVYSVLEYTIQAKHSYADDALLVDVMDKLLAFGAAAQAAFLPEGKEIAEEYDYDLTKKHSFAKLVDSVNLKNGASKVILEEGRSVPVRATDEGARDSGFYWYNDSIDYRGQSAAGSLTAELAYTDGKSETIFAVPADQAIFMDGYTGPTVYYYNSNGSTAFISNNLDAVDNPISAFNPVNINGKLSSAPAKLKDVTDLVGSGTINPGYIMIRGTANPNVRSDAIGARISAFVARGYKKFTVSYTMATTDNNTPKPPFGYVSLRVSTNNVILSSSASKDVGRLNLLTASYNKSPIKTGTNADATSASDTVLLFTPTTDNVLNGTNSINNYSDFFTVNMVITLAGDAEYGTIEYYVNGSAEPVATVRHYATDKFFQNKGVYLCIATSGSNSAYRSAIKSLVVTAGDIVNDYN